MVYEMMIRLSKSKRRAVRDQRHDAGQLGDKEPRAKSSSLTFAVVVFVVNHD